MEPVGPGACKAASGQASQKRGTGARARPESERYATQPKQDAAPFLGLRHAVGLARRLLLPTNTRHAGAEDLMLLDLKFTLRSLLKTPAFAAVTIITIALGIGGTVAIFSVVNAVLLAPLPYA